jgi:DNA mismatch repair protein MutL
MAKINILPAKVYNRIAAGEVVDRPYSVVKELLENSIDAGATEIEISIEKGGKQLIQVRDNGCGIARDDLQSALLPHATSKIATADDLDNILTLGFRGEAVASIAAVSKMTITSKTEGADCYSIHSDGGEMGEILLEPSGDNGTEVRVEMLFFNTPVRLKFLKSDKAEETDITNYISRFILNRPNIAFTYYVDGKKVLQSFGGGQEEAIVGVYGPSILQNCYEIQAEKHGIKIHGYIGNQNFSKPNKSYQSIFLNGRYIVNATISAAISGAYSSYLMKRQYPFYVLYITVPTQVVDVNVHPNKMDVRFADNQMIYGCIYSVISAVLDGQSKAMEYIVPSKYVQPPIEETVKDVLPQPEEKIEEVPLAKPFFKSTLLDEKPSGSPILMNLDREISSELDTERLKQVPGIELPFEIQEQPRTKGFTPVEELPEFTGELVTAEEQRAKGLFRKCDQIAAAKQLLKKFPELHFEPNYLRVESGEKHPSETEPKAEVDVFAENKKYLEELEKESGATRIEVDSCRYVGKLFNTYLIYEREDDVFLIDQHAAHERLIFDRLRVQMDTRSVVQQPMLLPYELNVNAFEKAFIDERIEDIRAMGFDIRENGANQFLISSVPMDLQSIKIDAFFNEILGDVSGFRSIKLADLLKDKLAMAACKAAIKGGMDITQLEIDKLFALIDGNMGLKCPHGRPVVTKISRTELEKMFRRKL